MKGKDSELNCLRHKREKATAYGRAGTKRNLNAALLATALSMGGKYFGVAVHLFVCLSICPCHSNFRSLQLPQLWLISLAELS